MSLFSIIFVKINYGYIFNYISEKINSLNNLYSVSIIEKSSKKTMSKIKKYVYKNFYKIEWININFKLMEKLVAKIAFNLKVFLI